MKIIMGIYSHDSGEIVVNGREMTVSPQQVKLTLSSLYPHFEKITKVSSNIFYLKDSIIFFAIFVNSSF